MPRPIRKGQLVNSINHFDFGIYFCGRKEDKFKAF